MKGVVPRLLQHSNRKSRKPVFFSVCQLFWTDLLQVVLVCFFQIGRLPKTCNSVLSKQSLLAITPSSLRCCSHAGGGRKSVGGATAAATEEELEESARKEEP